MFFSSLRDGPFRFCGWSLVFGALATPALLASGPVLRRFEFRQPHMGTLFRITLYAEDHAKAQRATAAAFARVAGLDDMMTDYRSTSELMRLCQKAGGPPVVVSNDLFTVLGQAQEISRLSDGAFDVTVGPLVRLWRQARRTQVLPDRKALERARALVGYQNVVLDPQKHTVELKKPGMQLDLGGIAKGYAADQALAVLRGQEIRQALVAAGGDIAVSEPPPEETGWLVGIEPLAGPTAPTVLHVRLRDAAISTSADTEQHADIGGKRYSHIVDPRTGMALTVARSVTVIAPRGVLSDSLTKVPSVLGPEGLGIIRRLPGVDGYLVQRDAAGKEEAFFTKGFQQRLQGRTRSKEEGSR